MGQLLRPVPGLSIPVDEISWTFTTSSGPGGQHANRASTRVEARFDVEASPSLDDDQRSRLVAACGREIRVAADESRSQHRNRQVALDRVSEKIARGLAAPPRLRRPTKPTRGARRRRLDDKRRRSETKQLRRKPDW